MPSPNLSRPFTSLTSLARIIDSCYRAVSVRAGTRQTTVAPASADFQALFIQESLVMEAVGIEPAQRSRRESRGAGGRRRFRSLAVCPDDDRVGKGATVDLIGVAAAAWKKCAGGPGDLRVGSVKLESGLQPRTAPDKSDCASVKANASHK